MRNPVIAVDGTAGSGKSSVSRGVAKRLGLRYLDTGAMYRAMTWAMLEEGIDVNDADAVAERSAHVAIESGTDPDAPTIHVGDVDVSGPIRGTAVTAAVSAVSAVPEVRRRLVDMQRAAVAAARVANEGIVVEGRDITTVVLPDADLKLYVIADPAVRAQRRAAQDAERGAQEVDVHHTKAALLERDALDSNREASPLAQAPDAVVIDNSHLPLDSVIDQVCALASAR